jgi:hypothetical protein
VEEAEWEIRRGKLRWLELLKGKLPVDWQLKYESWRTHLGDSDALAIERQAMWVGEAPIEENLAKLASPIAVLELLSGVQTERESPSELGREFSQLVSQNAEGYLLHSEKLRSLPSSYLRALLSGVHSSRQALSEESWRFVLELSQWVLDDHGSEEEGAWAECRSLIGDLVSAGLKYDNEQIPFSLRLQVWKVIESLTNDPNPTAAYEEKYGGQNMDPLTLSLNTVRGEAFHTLFKYIAWCRRKLNVSEPSLESTAEVLSVLENHLRPDLEPSLAVRAVYAERLPWLIACDPNWTQVNLEKIFPLGDLEAPLYRAAWETYVIWSHPYDNVYEALYPQYERALAHLNDPSFYRSGTSSTHLAEHLVSFYARGTIGLERGSLIQHFFRAAIPSLAAHVFWFIARIERESDVPADVHGRFAELIEQRVRLGSSEERTAFGWLFSSQKFDEEWSLKLLLECAASTQQADPDHSVIEKLAESSSRFPKIAIDVAIHLVDGADSDWKLQYWSEHLRTIIQSCIDSDELAAASLLVNKLAAKSFPEFRNMLPKE